MLTLASLVKTKLETVECPFLFCRRNAVCRWTFNGAKIVWDLQRGSTYLLSMVRKNIKANINVGSQVLMSPFVVRLMSSLFVENSFEKYFGNP